MGNIGVATGSATLLALVSPFDCFAEHLLLFEDVACAHHRLPKPLTRRRTKVITPYFEALSYKLGQFLVSQATIYSTPIVAFAFIRSTFSRWRAFSFSYERIGELSPSRNILDS